VQGPHRSSYVAAVTPVSNSIQRLSGTIQGAGGCAQGINVSHANIRAEQKPRVTC